MAENDDVQQLVAAARAAMAHAHAPYSRFAVGAAVRLIDGSIVTGCNFENASYGLSLCAETVALATVNAQGRFADVAAIAVVGGAMDSQDEALVTPCGRCRQVMNEAEQMAGRAQTIEEVFASVSSVAASGLNPPNTTLWAAPIRAQASMAMGNSGIMGR